MRIDQIKQCKEKLLLLLEAQNELEQEHDGSDDSVVLDQSGAGLLHGMVPEAIHTHDPQPQIEVTHRQQLQRHRIEGALHRISTHEYGFCSVCNQEIDYSRLEADPTVTRCLKCAGEL